MFVRIIKRRLTLLNLLPPQEYFLCSIFINLQKKLSRRRKYKTNPRQTDSFLRWNNSLNLVFRQLLMCFQQQSVIHDKVFKCALISSLVRLLNCKSENLEKLISVITYCLDCALCTSTLAEHSVIDTSSLQNNYILVWACLLSALQLRSNIQQFQMKQFGGLVNT